MTTEAALYAERSWNPFGGLHLTHQTLRAGTRATPLGALNLVAMADAYRRGQWLGGRGTLRPLDALETGAGVVPVTRLTGATRPVKVKQARAFAQSLGDLSLRLAGGAAAVQSLAAAAEHDRVPLWMGRRSATSPAGEVLVAVDRRLVRADVWGHGLPAARLRGEVGLRTDRPHPTTGISVWIADQRATLHVVDGVRKSRRSLTLRSARGHWKLTRRDRTTSELRRDGRTVALLSVPPPRARQADPAGLRALTQIDYVDTRDPLDAVVPHFCGVAFGIGDATGKIRFGARRPDPVREDDSGWPEPWYTSVGYSREDCGGATSDGHDGGTGADGCGSGSDGGGSGGGGGLGGWGDGGGGDGGGGGGGGGD